jgi:hypothetical protein
MELGHDIGFARDVNKTRHIHRKVKNAHLNSHQKTSACRTNSVDSEMCVRRIGYIETVGVYRYLGVIWTIQIYQKVISTLFSDVLVSQVLQIMIRSRGVSVSFSRGCSC